MNNNGNTALHIASASDEWDSKLCAAVLLKHGANVHFKTLDKRTPLLLASEYGRAPAAKLLLEHKANVHDKAFDDMTPLLFASKNGHDDIVSLLLEYNVDIVEDKTRKDNMTPLHFAVKGNFTQIVNLLLQKGANRRAMAKFGNAYVTPLIFACQYGYEDIASLIEWDVLKRQLALLL